MSRNYEPPDDFDRDPLKCGHQSYIAMRCEECGYQHCADCTHLAHNGVMTCRECVPVTVALLNREIAALASLMACTDLQATNAALLDDITDQITHRDGLLKFQAEQADKVNDGAAGMMTRASTEAAVPKVSGQKIGAPQLATCTENQIRLSGGAERRVQKPQSWQEPEPDRKTAIRAGTGRHQVQEAAHVTGEGRQRDGAKPAGYIPPSAAVLARAIIRHAERL